MENNKLLAEYLGYKRKNVKNDVQDYIYTTKDGIGMYEDDWHPHDDWNQLMMVVEKIEEGCSGFIPWLFICRVLSDKGKYQAGILSNIFSYGDTKIQAVYNACVEYIRAKSQNS